MIAPIVGTIRENGRVLLLLQRVCYHAFIIDILDNFVWAALDKLSK